MVVSDGQPAFSVKIKKTFFFVGEKYFLQPNFHGKEIQLKRKKCPTNFNFALSFTRCLWVFPFEVFLVEFFHFRKFFRKNAEGFVPFNGLIFATRTRNLFLAGIFKNKSIWNKIWSKIRNFFYRSIVLFFLPGIYFWRGFFKNKSIWNKIWSKIQNIFVPLDCAIFPTRNLFLAGIFQK